MHRQSLYRPSLRNQRRKLLDHDRRINKAATAQVLDLGVAENLRILRPVDYVGTRSWQLPGIGKRRAAIVGIQNARETHGVQRKSARVVVADDDMLSGRVHGNRRFRLAAGRSRNNVVILRKGARCLRAIFATFRIIQANVVIESHCNGLAR